MKKKNLIIIISAVVLVLILGIIIGIILYNNGNKKLVCEKKKETIDSEIIYYFEKDKLKKIEWTDTLYFASDEKAKSYYDLMKNGYLEEKDCEFSYNNEKVILKCTKHESEENSIDEIKETLEKNQYVCQ